MARSDVLVDADWVEAHLDDPSIVLVEVDEDTAAYDKNHIRGAVRLDWKADLQDQVRRDFVSKEQFEALLSSRGIGNDDTVVLYGGNNNWFAAYAYWYFKLYGHEDVKLLDGGRKKWELDSRELVEEQPTRAATTYKAKEPNNDIRAFRDEVIAAIGVKNLVDVRSPDEFSGKLLAPAHLPQEQSQRGWSHPDRREHPVEQGGQRGRHVPRRRRADDALLRGGRRPQRQGHDRLLPDRRAQRAHLVRAARAARPAERQELRRLVDRVRLARRRPDREGRLSMCGSPDQATIDREGIPAGATVIQGLVYPAKSR